MLINQLKINTNNKCYMYGTLGQQINNPNQRKTPISQSTSQTCQPQVSQKQSLIPLNPCPSSHNPYGNFLIIYSSPNLTLTLGPDYWCFIPAFICFAIAGLGVLYIVMKSTDSLIVRLAGIVVCGGELLAYAMVALSNPGIAQDYTAQENISSVQYQPQSAKQTKKICKKCNFYVPKSSHHCRDCDVCIIGYDHHCPWTSKCIGEGNLKRFYFFIIMTPVFLIYTTIAFVIIMSDNVHAGNRQHITGAQ